MCCGVCHSPAMPASPRRSAAGDRATQVRPVVELVDLPAGRRTQAERRATTQAKLLDAAVECLVEQGYAATSVVDVQQRAGVSRGALQHYWPSRAALMVDAVKALFDSMAARLRAEMADHAARVTHPNPTRRIEV